MKYKLILVIAANFFVLVFLLGIFALFWFFKNKLPVETPYPPKEISSSSLPIPVLTPAPQKNVKIIEDKQSVSTINPSYYSTNVDGK